MGLARRSLAGVRYQIGVRHQIKLNPLRPHILASIRPIDPYHSEMARDDDDWIGVLDLWTFVGIISFLFVCWKRVSYVG